MNVKLRQGHIASTNCVSIQWAASHALSVSVASIIIKLVTHGQ